MQLRHRVTASFLGSAFFCLLFAGCAQPSGGASSHPALKLAWDWNGIIGTGQSLGVGEKGIPVKATNQPYGNLKLSTGKLPWPVDPNDPTLALVPLTEPVGRKSPSYPSSWPENIAGETPHTAMGNELTALVRAAGGRDFISIHGDVGENGQGMVFIKKNPTPRGLNGRAYEASMIETKAITRLAKAAGKTYGVGAITVTHGESDAGNAQYESQLYLLWSNYNADIAAITGQTQKILMIISQQNTSGGDHTPSTLAVWKAGVDHPAELVCSGPKYQYPYATDFLHLTTDGYELLGEKYAEVYFQRVILGNDWRPLEPLSVQRMEGKDSVLVIHFHVPSPPMVWSTNFPEPHQSFAEWKNGKGFEVTGASGARVAINSVEISGDAVVITCASDPGANAKIGYAMVGDPTPGGAYGAKTHRGLLCDSDPFVGDTTKKAQPNFSVAFEMTAP